MQQLQLQVDSAELVRAAEEVMVLTRGLKELWVFGGLDTVGVREGEGGLKVEEGRVGRELEGWVAGYEERRRRREGSGGEGLGEGEEGKG